MGVRRSTVQGCENWRTGCSFHGNGRSRGGGLQHLRQQEERGEPAAQGALSRAEPRADMELGVGSRGENGRHPPPPRGQHWKPQLHRQPWWQPRVQVLESDNLGSNLNSDTCTLVSCVTLRELINLPGPRFFICKMRPTKGSSLS